MRLFVSLALLLSIPSRGQSPCTVRHLTIFDANVAEFLEERTPALQPGLNSLEWRSLMPQAAIRTLRVTGDRLTVLRQDITYDGPDVRNQKSPVLRLSLQNNAAAGARPVQVDYLAPNLSWSGDHSILLSPTKDGVPPSEMTIDSWITVNNNTGADVCAGVVDLVAGEVQLLTHGGGSIPRDFVANAQVGSRGFAEQESTGGAGGISGLSVFSLITLGKDISLNASVPFNRFPLFQRLKLPVEQRNIFENEP